VPNPGGRSQSGGGPSRAAIPGLPEWRQRDIGDESSFLAAWLFYDAGQYGRAIAALEAFARAAAEALRAGHAVDALLEQIEGVKR